MGWDTGKQVGKIVSIVEKSKIFYVNMEDIMHITCDGYVSTVYLANGTAYSSARLLKLYEEDVEQYGFLRANRHTLVNIRHISDVQRTKRILHIGDIIISVSKRKISLFKNN